MSFSLLLTAINEYVADILVNDCARPLPTRQLSYHGRLPHDCCTDDGFLVTSWESGRSVGEQPCAGIPTFTITIRYVVCWDIPSAGEHGIDITDAQDTAWNDDALMLADVADCVARSLIRLGCIIEDPFADAIFEQSIARTLRFTGVSPIVPLGGCAGVQWQLEAAVLQGSAIS